MARPTKPLHLKPEEQKLLEGIAGSRNTPYSLVVRTQIILKAAAGENNKKIGQDLDLSENSVGMWRQRWLEGSLELEKIISKPKEWRLKVEKLLGDKPRQGSPVRFSAEQVCQVIALACEQPPEYLSHWTRIELARMVRQRGIAENMSPTTIGRFLKSGRSQATSS
jgi:transposase